MAELLVALDAFLQEHRRWGELDGGVDAELVWMNCECGAQLARQALDQKRRAQEGIGG